MRTALTIALFSLPQWVVADGLLRPFPDTSQLKPAGSAWQADHLLWLLCLAGVVLAVIALSTRIQAGGPAPAAGKAGLATPALVLPAAMLVLLLEFLLWGLLDASLGILASAVFGVLLGIVSLQGGLKQLVRISEQRLAHGPLTTPLFHAAVRTLFECASVALILFLTAFVPFECSAFALLAFTMGQLLVARLGAVERDQFATAVGGEVFTEATSITVRQNALLTAFAFVGDITFSAYTLPATELTAWLLAVRVLQPIVILPLEWRLIPALAGRLGQAHRRELGTWVNALATFTLLFGSALLILRVLRAEGFWIHHDFWWLIALTAGMGLGIRLALFEAALFFADWLGRRQPAEGGGALMMLNMQRGGEGFALLIGMLISIACLQTEPLQLLLNGTPGHAAWALAMTLFAFGCNLGDALSCPDSDPAATEPAGSAPRYDIELLALAGAAVLLLTEAFEEPVRQFSLVHSKAAIGIILGVLLHGFMFPFTLPVPAGDAVRSERDRAILNVRRVHLFLALFFLQLGLSVGLACLSVFVFTTAVFVMVVLDVFVAPGKPVEERFIQHSWLCFSLVATAIATELIRLLSGNGLDFLTLLGGLGDRLGASGHLNGLRYLLGGLSIAGGLAIAALLYRRGIRYQPPETGNGS